MRQIIFFFIRNKNFLLFVFLFLFSVGLTIRTHSFHKNVYVSSSNVISGTIYSIRNNIVGYFGLRKEIRKLVEENAELRKSNEHYKSVTILLPDSSLTFFKYTFTSAEVINNNFAGAKNNLTINKGSKDSLQIDLGVVSSKGIVGIINNVSEKYATVQSILNTKSQINSKLKNSQHFGSLVWDMKDPNVVQLIDIPRLADIAIGDTVVTGGMSTIFPKDILIGSIKDFSLEEDENYYHIDVQLFNDMTDLKNVYIIDNKEREEIRTLEKMVEDAEQ